METATQTVEQFIAKHGIKMIVSKHNKSSVSAMNQILNATHWFCTFRRKDASHQRTFSATYTMGAAYKGRKPTVAEVVICLRDDAHLSRSGECEDMGLDPVPIEKQTSRLLVWLGEANFNELLETEG